MHIFFCEFKLRSSQDGKKAGKVYCKLLSIESLSRDALNSVHFSNFKEYIYKFFESHIYLPGIPFGRAPIINAFSSA